MLPWLLLAGALSAQTCNKTCELRYMDVFGCCPDSPTTPFPRAHVDVAVTVVRVDPALTSRGAGVAPFQVSRAEVTQALYQSIMATVPLSRSATDPGDQAPVALLSWCEAVIFANRLSAREWLRPAYRLPEGFRPGLDDATCRSLAPQVVLDARAPGWRLPRVDEWEAATAGAPPVEALERGEVAWYASNADGHAHPVCSRKPWSHGLCDLQGNVREWAHGLEGPVSCGSGFLTPGPQVATAGCVAADPATRAADLGFRLVRP